MYLDVFRYDYLFTFIATINEVGSGFVLTGTGYQRDTLVYKPILQFFSHPFLLWCLRVFS